MSKNLFKGMAFYFYPPKSIYRLNGIRASASAKNGAKVHNSVQAETTHILVAPSGNTAIFWSMVNSSPISNTCLILKDSWTSDCIESGQLADTDNYVVKEASKEVASSPFSKPEHPDQSPKKRKVDPERNNNEPEAISQPASPNQSPPKPHSHSPVVKAKRENAIHDAFPDLPKAEKLPQRETSPAPQTASSKSPQTNVITSQNITSGTAAHHNQMIIEIFHNLMLSRQTAGEEFGARAYERALKKIEKLDVMITSGSQASELTGISRNMAQVVDGILNGTVTCRVSQGHREKMNTINLFATVYGVGRYTARKLYNDGHRTLDDLRRVLDENARVSIDHHDDFIERISRGEVSQHYEAVKRVAAKIDDKMELHCMGSYRRGQPDCGDIDIIVTKRDMKSRELKSFLRVLLKNMKAEGLATYTFSHGSDRWLGSTQVISKWRRMDILLVPWAELGAAMIYYTGNDNFNRELRWHAKANNMRLNQNGLFKVDANDNKKELLEAHSEERIFEILKRPFLPPEKRIKS